MVEECNAISILYNLFVSQGSNGFETMVGQNTFAEKPPRRPESMNISGFEKFSRRAVSHPLEYQNSDTGFTADVELHT